jgi:hypothetical protein
METVFLGKGYGNGILELKYIAFYFASVAMTHSELSDIESIVLTAVSLKHVLQEKTAVLKTLVFQYGVVYIHICVLEKLGFSIKRVIQWGSTLFRLS